MGKAAAVVGEAATLECDIWSYPPVTSIQFYRNSMVIDATGQLVIQAVEYNVSGNIYNQRRSLKFQSVAESDYGLYSCQAANSLRNVEIGLELLRPGTILFRSIKL